MRVVSWNMGANSVRRSRHDPAWHHLLDSAPGNGADLALVQEAGPPGWLGDDHRIHWVQAWPTRNWGTGIVVKRTSDLIPLDTVMVEGGRFAAARIETDEHQFVVVSVHAQTSVPEFMPPLVATFEVIRELCANSPFIVGGDFNTSRSAEGFWPGNGHRPFWDTLDATGFHSCYWAEHGEEAITYRHPTGPFVGQADHILIDRQTASTATVACWVDEDPAAVGLSDHRALVADIGLRP